MRDLRRLQRGRAACRLVKTGSLALADVLEAMRDAGTHHAFLNLVPNGMQAHENLEIIARDVLPAFG
ncbi:MULTISPECIES: hypothetical protein [unclassified Luteimonas]